MNPINLNFSGILFDLDGTLLDTAPEFETALKLVLQEEKQNIALSSQAIRIAVNHGIQNLITLGFNIHPDHHRYEILSHRLLQHYSNQLGQQAILFPGIIECLSQLNHHQIPWGIVTNKFEKFTLPLVDKIPDLKGAQIIVSGDTLEHAKPHPAPLEYACKKMCLKPHQTLYVGDAQRDMQAAQAAGMPCVLATYGYLSPNDTPHTWGANYSIDHADQLLKIIIRS